MALTHGQLPPIDDLSVVDFQKSISLTYGPSVTGIGEIIWSSNILDPNYGTYSNNCNGLRGGLRRYVFNYNLATNTYDHVQTYKSCRSLYENQSTITDVSLLNCVFNIHGAALFGASEAPPQGLAAKLNEVFARPIVGQNLFIDCVSKVLSIVSNPIFTNQITINNRFKTYVYRYGVMKNNQVFYFKNTLRSQAVKRINEPACRVTPQLGSCDLLLGEINSITQNQCNMLGGVWTVNP